ncbi:hypothetical protein QA601_06010 [Chitinispirillales bacterium ANBcel5]|uniref:hypothetical protein n=1 Tax=Cellulosispirillum alkaliphilum TaxID=3039283 RepID=UPI002A4E9A9C|nr:hypothetical protein [Chitinispirillales bacterium ANBcel5]
MVQSLNKLMKTVYLSLLVLLTLFYSVSAQNNTKISLGINVMLGARYDDTRMCVASPAGVKGGPIADVMFNTRLHFNDTWSVGFKLPIMRPILFATAFDMLQFEPEFIVEYTHQISDDIGLVVGPGLGISFHYGPDYKTEQDDSDPHKFAAAGPFISALIGMKFQSSAGSSRIIGLRPFYAPLFSDDYRSGTVLGAALEGHFDFFKQP